MKIVGMRLAKLEEKEVQKDGTGTTTTYTAVFEIPGATVTVKQEDDTFNDLTLGMTYAVDIKTSQTKIMP